MNDTIISIVSVVIVLGIMILAHEWGHYIAARLCKVRVDIFSIGFGRRIWGRRYGDTDFRLSLLPLGGFVKMAGDNPLEERAGADDEFLSKPRWQRAIIALGGPVMNIILALVLIIGLFAVLGLPYPAYLTRPAEIAGLPKVSAARDAGLQVGDHIVELNGKAVTNWEDVARTFQAVKAGSALRVLVERESEKKTFDVPVADPPDVYSALGFPMIPPRIEQVVPNKPADKSGLRADDQFVAVNGREVRTWPEIQELIRGSNGQELLLKVLRRGREVEFRVTPVSERLGPQGQPVWQIGILPIRDEVYRKVGLFEAVKQGVAANVAGTRLIVGIVGQLFTGRESLRNMQSVIGISREAGQAAKRGPVRFIELMAVISLNLAILNLLPIPILDGGHLLMLAIEGTIRRDLSVAVKERFVQVGMVFLLVVFAIVMYNDVLRLLPR
jgi:regulator of sigma E protease